MIKWALLPRSTHLLAFSLACLTLGAGATLLMGTQTEALLATPAQPIAPSAPISDALARRDSFSGVQERALFYRSRAYHVPTSATAASAALPVPAYELAGAFVVPHGSAVAVLKSRTASVSRTVRPGDELDGWRVQAIDKDRVVLVQGAQRAEILHATPPPGLIALKVSPEPASFRVAARNAASPPAPALAAAPASARPLQPGVQPRLFPPEQR